MNRRKQNSPRKSNSSETRKARTNAPRTLAEYNSKSPRYQDRWNRITHVVSRMRADRVSLRQASREFGLSSQTVIRLGGSALRKRTNGQYVARASDRMLRVLVIPTAKGLQEVAVKDSRHASELGKYWDAIQNYLETGDSERLRKFGPKQIKDATGIQIPLIADLAELDRLGSAGVLSFESLYARAA
jgi:hypothetical protein